LVGGLTNLSHFEHIGRSAGFVLAALIAAHAQRERGSHPFLSP
jgi:hypothetical protein